MIMTEQSLALDGRSALITGGASGIGAAIARHLAGRGAAVRIADVDADRCPGAGGRARRRGLDARPHRPGLPCRVGDQHRHLDQQRRHPARQSDPGLRSGDLPADSDDHGRSAVPADQGGAAGHVRARFRPHREHLLRARPARLGVQVRLRDGQARPGGTVQGDGPGGRGARRDQQLHQSGLRPDAAGGEADRRPGQDARHRRVRGGGEDHAGPLGDQAAGRTRRGRLAGRLAGRPGCRRW